MALLRSYQIDFRNFEDEQRRREEAGARQLRAADALAEQDRKETEDQARRLSEQREMSKLHQSDSPQPRRSLLLAERPSARKLIEFFDAAGVSVTIYIKDISFFHVIVSGKLFGDTPALPENAGPGHPAWRNLTDRIAWSNARDKLANAVKRYATIGAGLMVEPASDKTGFAIMHDGTGSRSSAHPLPRSVGSSSTGTFWSRDLTGTRWLGCCAARGWTFPAMLAGRPRH